MRIVFMGTPRFAAIILERLAQSKDVVGVFTQPDAVRSRGKKLDPSPVKMCALDHDIPVFEYATFKDNDALNQLKSLEPDVVCVAAYGVLLPEEVIDLPRYGCLNVHGSLLPRWRGAAPIERAILADDAQLGVCIMHMEAGLDTGDFCLVKAVPNHGQTAPEFTEALAELGGEALIEALDGLEAGNIAWTVQDEAQVTYAHKIEKGELDLVPEMQRDAALRAVRASSENHPAKCVIGGKEITLVKAALPVDPPDQVQDIAAGQVLFVAKKLYLGFSNGALEVLEVHPAGKKQMLARDFAAGLQGVKRGDVSWSTHDN
ncbi:methionyl-tRNA formyltransferase [Anaerotardibacter muris]|uniref:methionyl-tRNA formyltransferase n=1 Tax=Anaerotardibacter muris TaxID=2941505 RepID=UPI00203CD824|nr:methionyl-tRNA formyltransferase [Anaerotardibacter muris]